MPPEPEELEGLADLGAEAVPEDLEDLGAENTLDLEAHVQEVRSKLDAQQKAIQSPAVAEGIARSAFQGATFNFGDEILAGAKSLGNQTYEQALQEERAKLELARQHPGAKTAEMLGSGAWALVPGLGQIGAGRALATGAALGGLSAAGESEGGVLDRAQAAVPGAAIGAATAGAGVGIGKALSAAGPKLAGMAAEKVADQMGATPYQLLRIQKKFGGVRQLGEKMHELGLTGTSARVARKAIEAQEATGAQIGQIYKAADEAVMKAPVVDLESIRAKIQKLSDRYSGMHEGTKVKKVYQEYLEGLSPKNRATDHFMSFKKTDIETIPRMHTKMQLMDDEIFSNSTSTIRKEALKEIRAIYREEIDKAVEKAVPDLFPELKKANEAYSLASEVAPQAERAAGLHSSENFFGVRNMLAAAIGDTAGGLPLAVGAAVGRPIAARYGKTVGAAALRGLGQTSAALAPHAQRASIVGTSSAGSAIAQEPSIRNSTTTAKQNLNKLGAAGIRLSQAAQKGDEEFNSEHYRLWLSDHAYRKKISELKDKD